MTDFRVEIIDYFTGFKEALSQQVVAQAGPEYGASKLLRNGLAVVGFTVLEDFVKKRFSRAFEEIAQTRIMFEELPEKIQKAVTYEAVVSINHQLGLRRHWPHAEKLSFIQGEASKIASTSNGRDFDLTGYAFGFGKSNVSESDIKEALTCFHVLQPWEAMTSISQVLGMTTLPLNNSYKNASERRHHAAHVAHADTPYTDLENYVNEALSIAVAIDVVLSGCIKRIASIDEKYLSGEKKYKLVFHDFPFYFVKYERNKWKVFSSKNLNRAKVTGVNELQVFDKAIQLAARDKLPVIFFDANGSLCRWQSSLD